MSNECKAVPANCRQRLAAEGKPYPKSSCASCGQFSPKWRECESMLARPVYQPPALDDDLERGMDLGMFLAEMKNVKAERDQLKAEAEQLSETSMSQESLIEQLTDSLANHDSVSKVMNAWVAEKGQMPWATTIKTLAIITKMPDQERDRLLNMDDGGTERGALIEERDRLQARCDEQAKTLSTLVAVARTVNRNAASETSVPGDDEPQYRQRKEWIEYLLETCAEAEALSKPAGSEQA